MAGSEQCAAFHQLCYTMCGFFIDFMPGRALKGSWVLYFLHTISGEAQFCPFLSAKAPHTLISVMGRSALFRETVKQCYKHVDIKCSIFLSSKEIRGHMLPA
ncbi:hypothetical protein PGIGA_G00048360, partial [Pangasianodon gigas]|nr:hypothetical protein [Pangasianodon gigas]